jgi:hypothetical protein
VDRNRAYRSVRRNTVGDLGKAHQIHATVNNCLTENKLTVLKTSGNFADQTLRILIYPCAIENFISGATLRIIKVKAVEHDEFSLYKWLREPNKRLEGRLQAISLTWDILSRGPTCTS